MTGNDFQNWIRVDKDGNIIGDIGFLPKSWIVPDGPTYCGGFQNLDVEQLIEYGWYPVEEILPSYDINTQILTGPINTILTDKVQVVYTIVEKDLDIQKQNVLIQIKNIRKQTHDLYVKQSPGVASVYADNLDAALRFQANDETIMPTGQTPTAYLTGMGTYIGMQAAQFAAYIISENRRLSAPGQTPPGAYDIEQRYLISSAGISMATNGDTLRTILNNYIDFCSTVTGN